MKKILTTLFCAAALGASAQQLVCEPAKGTFDAGLSGKHIALWHSHGWFYEPTLDRWEWQRARCFQNVEDIGNMAYVVTYLTPMLENAGAVVLNPRERDPQPLKVVVDNDNRQGKLTKKGRWQTIKGGYKQSDILYERRNPFTEGTFLQAVASHKTTASLTYTPNIPESGRYGVYVSWHQSPDNVSDAHYEVYHTGGVSRFTVNQKMFGQTWHYLGTFEFSKGLAGAVVVTNQSAQKGIVSSDAVRFGGGMGFVARRPSSLVTGLVKSSSEEKPVEQPLNPDNYSWKTGGYPAYLEGARYYLQGAGIPDSVYSRTNYKNDYNDDYMSRGAWVNYLKKNGIPIDLSLAFHTDAGTTSNDSIIGTLSIYSTRGERFSDGRPRTLSGDMSTLIHEQIVSDIRRGHNAKWTRRQVRDANYNEASTPDVPALLLELLSHQNLADMTYSLDPRFRFTVARAIYKGIARFLKGEDAVIQPLAPNSFAIKRVGKRTVELSWKPTIDTLEATALSKSYRIYIRKNDSGYQPDFIEVNTTSTTIELPSYGDRYALRIAAVNRGGESFPTEELSTCLYDNDRGTALLVNGFTRVSAPSWFDKGELAGFSAAWDDEGVFDGREMAHLGNQYEFERSNPWRDDDNTGWGSTGIEGYGKVIAGNTHNFTNRQGAAYQRLGYSYVSSSMEAFVSDNVAEKFSVVEILFGEQRTVRNFRSEKQNGSFQVYTPALLAKLDELLSAKTPLLISGAYIATDMFEQNDTIAMKFAADRLGYKFMTNRADRSGRVVATDGAKKYLSGSFDFNIDLTPDIYRVEAPDGIEVAGGAIRAMRYGAIPISAATLYENRGERVAALGFPIETIKNEAERVRLMKGLLDFLLNR